MPDAVPADVLQTWQTIGPVLDERAQFLAQSARAGMVDRAALAAIDARFVDAVSALAAARDVCDAAADVPVVLLPVRLETRFDTDDAGRPVLKVRIYPDELHVDNLDRGVDDDEAAAGRAWWNAIWHTPDPLPPEPWSQFVSSVGNARAEWIAHALTPTNLAQRGEVDGPTFPDIVPRLGRGAVVRGLPDRFVVVARQGGIVSTQTGRPIPPDLAVAPIAQDGSQPVATSSGLLLPAGTEWTVDYAQAEAVGMAITLPLAGGSVTIDRLFAIGVRGSFDPGRGATELENLLEGHRFSDGLDVLPQSTPTNNSDAERSPWQPRRTPLAPPLTPVGAPPAGTDAASVSAVLNVNGAPLGDIAHGGGTEQALAASANVALWGPGWGYFLSRMTGAGLDDARREQARDLFRDRVRGRGPSPALRIGRQPYGVLPVSSLGRWVARDGERTAMLINLLRNARRRWLAAAEGVPRVRRGGAGLDTQMLEAMGSSPVMQGLRVRPVVSDDVSSATLATIGADRERYRSERDLTRALMADYGLPPTTSVGSLHEDSRPLPLPLVADSDADRIEALLAGGTPQVSSVLQALLALAWDDAEQTVAQAAPTSTLPHLVDQATTLSAEARVSVTSILATADTVPAPQLHGVANRVIAEVGAGGPALLASYQPFPAIQTSLAEVALAAPAADATSRFIGVALGAWVRAMARRAEVRDAMRQLGAAPKDQRALVVAESLDLASHRLDAWITAVVDDRRATLAAAQPRGLTLGAYGVVENLMPGVGNAPAGGWIHGLSPAHAVAAGVLRSAHLSHIPDDGNGGPFAVDLSSQRVALATHLLDGVRGGQQLAALVGYRIERLLIEAGLGRFVLSLREVAPLVARRLTDRADGADQGARETVAAAQVVDGLVLLHQHGTGDDALKARLTQTPVNVYLPADLWHGPNPTEWPLIQAILAQAADAVDAVSDVLLAESIMQHAVGNPARAAATLDVAASGGAVPEDPAVLGIQSTGERLTHRLLILAADGEVGWAAGRPRALAEPRLEAWAARRLGPPDQVVVADTAGARFTLADAGVCALDVVLGSADPIGLEQTLRIALPGLTPGVALSQRRDPAWPAGVRGIGEIVNLAVSLRDVLSTARPVLPNDLTRPGVASTRLLRPAVDDMIARVRTAAGTLTTAAASLAGLLSPLVGADAAPDAATAAAVDRAVWALDSYALAVPGGAAASLDPARAASAAADARARAAQAALDRASQPDQPTELVIEAVEEAARAVFGEAFRVVPLLPAPDAGDEFAAAVNQPAFIQPGGARVRRFVRDVASVRRGVARYAETLLVADALDRPVPPSVLQVSESGGAGTDRWLGAPIPPGGVWPERPVAHVVVDAAGGLSGSAQLGGLVVDAWVEMLPSQPAPKGGAVNRVVTGLAMNAGAAPARAPQSILVAVSPDGQRWTQQSLVDVLDETLDLARARLVALERTLGDARVLPALYTRSWALQGQKTMNFSQLATLGVRYSAMQYVREAQP